jgi:hypothetical protein
MEYELPVRIELRERLTAVVRGRPILSVFGAVHLIVAMMEEAAPFDCSRDDKLQLMVEAWHTHARHSVVSELDARTLIQTLYDTYDRKLVLDRWCLCWI